MSADGGDLGSAIRQRRQAQGLTLVELAAATGLSQPFLSQIENGRARPSMASLYRIARSLGTTPQAFFGGPSGGHGVPSVRRSEAVTVVTVGERAGRSGGPGGSGAEALCRLLVGGDAPVRVLEFVDLPTAFLDPWEHDGFEAIVVVEGTIELDVAGELSTLRAGDVASYPARRPHRMRAAAPGSTRVLLIETDTEAASGPATEPTTEPVTEPATGADERAPGSAARHRSKRTRHAPVIDAINTGGRRMEPVQRPSSEVSP